MIINHVFFAFKKYNVLSLHSELKGTKPYEIVLLKNIQRFEKQIIKIYFLDEAKYP